MIDEKKEERTFKKERKNDRTAGRRKNEKERMIDEKKEERTKKKE